MQSNQKSLLPISNLPAGPAVQPAGPGVAAVVVAVVLAVGVAVLAASCIGKRVLKGKFRPLC